MTIKDLIDTVKFDLNTKNIDYTSKNCSKDNNNGFLNVFKSANKSNNFSFDDTEKLSYKKLNQYTEKKDLNSKVFKSEYESFYNKLDVNKNINNPMKKEVISKAKESISEAKQEKKEIISEAKDTVSQTKEEKKEVVSEAKDTISENKDDKKEVVSEAKDTVSQAKEEKKEVISEAKETVSEVKEENNTAEIVQNINSNNLNILVQENIKIANTVLNQEEQPQEALKNNTIVNDNSAETLPEELTPIQKQIANEKITNKQAGNILQQQLIGVEQENSEDQTQITKINPEELKKTDANITDQPIKQAQSQKPEILASEDVLNKLNADKNQITQPQVENLKPISDKLAQTINNEESKPVITNIEVKNTSSKTDLDDQSQKQTQQELKPNINQIQVLSSDENNLQKIEISKTSQFDKILNTKQTQNMENNILNQIKDKISSEISTNKSQVTIALRPDNLGRVNINLVSQNGVLTAQITAESNQVKDILNKGLETLKQNMAEQGINVGKMVVNVQEPTSSNQNMNSEQNLKDFEQANSNTSNMNYQSNKQTYSEEGTSAYSDDQLYEFDEEAENENEMSELNVLAGQSPVIRAGKVDYKV